MQRLVYECIQKVVWSYLDQFVGTEYTRRLPLFNEFLDYVYVSMGLE